jgi:uncharacterized integral membrane protein
MAFGYLVVAVLAAAIAVFALQNGTPTDVRFLWWSVHALPVSALILVSLGVGLVVAGVPLLLQRWRLRSRVRSLEARVHMLEGAVAERAQATLAQRPPAPRPTQAGER